MTQKMDKEKISQYMFETLRIPAISFVPQPSLIANSLYLSTSNIPTVLVVDVGEGAISVTPIVDGNMIGSAVEHWEYGGGNVTDCLQRLIQREGRTFSSSSELDITKEIKV
jgi:actin-related protein